MSEQRTFGPGEGGYVTEAARDFIRSLPRGYKTNDHNTLYADGALKIVVQYWTDSDGGAG